MTAARLWLMKSEPDVFGIDDLAKKKTEGWNGVRNYEARNFMKSMKTGDKVLFYHSNAKPSGVAGIAVVSRLAYPDPTQFDPKSDYFEPRATPESPVWFQVDLRFVSKLTRVVPLDELRGTPALAGMALFKRSRLSVIPVTALEWKIITGLAKS
ncbi:MAG: EVE domain-containing protein [Elusimicrobiota bacterium]|nr:EVE domain-containing protein [Elusimicrobiota bacterium]